MNGLIRRRRSSVSLAALVLATPGLVAAYDPSDLSTLFQDASGTIPAGVGDPVRLMLDKSQGLARGPELLTNGGFDADLSSWTDRSSGTGSATWTASGVEIIRVDLANTGQITQDIAVTEGEWYQFTFTGVSGGGAAFRLGSTTASNQLYDSIIPIGPSTVIVRATTSLISIGLRGAINGSTTVIDDVSMRHLPGNHLTAPSDAARPVLQSSGGLYWLEFDGVDDELATASALPFSTSIFNCTAFRLTSYNKAFPGVVQHRVGGSTSFAPFIYLKDGDNNIRMQFGTSLLTVIGYTSRLGIDIVASGYVSETSQAFDVGYGEESGGGTTLTDTGTGAFQISGEVGLQAVSIARFSATRSLPRHSRAKFASGLPTSLEVPHDRLHQPHRLPRSGRTRRCL